MSRPDEVALASTLLVARTTARVVGRLMAADVPCIVLKGAGLASWLYAPGERQFVDSDVLVPRGKLAAALAVLDDIGYVPPLLAASPWEQDGHSVVCTNERAGPGFFGEVDVHFSLPGAADADSVWPALQEHLAEFVSGGVSLPGLDTVAQALVVTLHAARDGAVNPQVLEDLRRCLTRLSDGQWREAAALSGTIDAAPAFARGLELSPEGRRIASVIGLAGVTSVEMELRRAEAPPLAYGLDRLVGLSPRARVRLILRELWPTTAFLEHWAQLTGRSARSVKHLRLSRWADLARNGPGAWLAWRRGVKAASASRSFRRRSGPLD